MAERGYVYERLAPANRQALAEIVHRLCPPPAYLLRERIDNLALEELAPDWVDQVMIDRTVVWAEGRVFGLQCEVRWLRVDDDAYQVMLLTEQSPRGGPGGGWAEPVEYQVAEQQAFLWGDWDEDIRAYWQTSIPRTLAWPICGQEGVPYAALQTVEYLRDGITVLARLRGIVTTNERGEVV